MLKICPDLFHELWNEFMEATVRNTLHIFISKKCLKRKSYIFLFMFYPCFCSLLPSLCLHHCVVSGDQYCAALTLSLSVSLFTRPQTDKSWLSLNTITNCTITAGRERSFTFTVLLFLCVQQPRRVKNMKSPGEIGTGIFAVSCAFSFWSFCELTIHVFVLQDAAPNNQDTVSYLHAG